jgi:hypothetical protein
LYSGTNAFSVIFIGVVVEVVEVEVEVVEMWWWCCKQEKKKWMKEG